MGTSLCCSGSGKMGWLYPDSNSLIDLRAKSCCSAPATQQDLSALIAIFCVSGVALRPVLALMTLMSLSWGLLPYPVPIGWGAPFRLRAGVSLSSAGDVFVSAQGVPVLSHGPPGSALPPVGWHPTLSLSGISVLHLSVVTSPDLVLALPAWSWACRSAWSCLMARTAGGPWLPSLGCSALLPQVAQGGWAACPGCAGSAWGEHGASCLGTSWGGELETRAWKLLQHLKLFFSLLVEKWSVWPLGLLCTSRTEAASVSLSVLWLMN